MTGSGRRERTREGRVRATVAADHALGRLGFRDDRSRIRVRIARRPIWPGGLWPHRSRVHPDSHRDGRAAVSVEYGRSRQVITDHGIVARARAAALGIRLDGILVFDPDRFDGRTHDGLRDLRCHRWCAHTRCSRWHRDSPGRSHRGHALELRPDHHGRRAGERQLAGTSRPPPADSGSRSMRRARCR
jgi:hypothetical protein